MLGMVCFWLMLVFFGVMFLVLALLLLVCIFEILRYFILKNRRKDVLLVLVVFRGSYIDVEDECRDIEEGFM